MKSYYNDAFKIEVNGEKLLACDILDDLTEYDKKSVLELNPGESAWIMLEGNSVSVVRPYPTIEEEWMALYGH